MGPSHRSRAGARLAVFSALLAGCNGGGGGSSSSSPNSLAGTIHGPGFTALEDAVVQVIGATTRQATTDVNGNFIVLQPPTGLVRLRVDGTTVPTGRFPVLELPMVVGGGASNLAQPIVLPDLDTGATVDVPVDANGLTIGATAVGDALVDGFSLALPDATAITVDGAPPPGGTVALDVTPVEAIEVPMPLPGRLNPGAFVTIQPSGAAFGPALSITLPNTGGFPLGAEVDIWSFDREVGAWVNRSQETGHRGTVVDIGGTEFIVANEVITEGGWHAGALPVDETCATTLTGQVFAAGTQVPMPGALISLSTGQFARTDAAGRFRIDAVPAYDAGELPGTCLARELELRALAPVAFAANQTVLTIPAGAIRTGAATVLAPIGVVDASAGPLVGSVSDAGQPVEGTVSITGTQQLEATTDAFGNFFLVGLLPGDYVASFEFEDGFVFEGFTIAAHETTVLQINSRPHTGPASVEVQVLNALDHDHPTPIPGACVTLVGASGAQFAVADGSGIAAFPSAPAGPYTITAQMDLPDGFQTIRAATTLVGVLPSSDPGTIVLPFLDLVAGPGGIPSDSTLVGTVLNPPPNLDLEYQIALSINFSIDGQALGGFSRDVPSEVPFDVAVVARQPSGGPRVSAVFVSDVMIAKGGTLMLDFDFANAVPFDQDVSVSYANAPAADELAARLELFGGAALALAEGDGTELPRQLVWPDLASPALAAFDPFFEVETRTFTPTFQDSVCALPLGHVTPTSLQVSLLGAPAIQSPADGARFPSYGPGRVVAFRLGARAGTGDGFNDVTLVGGQEGGEIFTFWELFVPAGQTRVTLPPVFPGKPLFGPGTYSVGVENARFALPGFDFATFFDQNFPSNLAALDASARCAARRFQTFAVGETQGILVPLQREHPPRRWWR